MHFTSLIRVCLACAVLGVIAPARVEAASCVTMVLFDQYGAVVQTPAPVIGFLLGGAPVLDGALPPHFSRKPGLATPCPEDLIEKIRDLFNTSCPSEERRKAAALKNSSKPEDVNKGCANMVETLSAPATK